MIHLLLSLPLVLRLVLLATKESGAQQLAHFELAEEEKDGKTKMRLR
jgi:hypothetical protein